MCTTVISASSSIDEGGPSTAIGFFFRLVFRVTELQQRPADLIQFRACDVNAYKVLLADESEMDATWCVSPR